MILTGKEISGRIRGPFDLDLPFHVVNIKGSARSEHIFEGSHALARAVT